MKSHLTAVQVFYDKNSNINKLHQADTQCKLLALCGATKSEKHLNHFRCKRFVKGVKKRSKMSRAYLPPSSNAELQHIKRVYLQIQQSLAN